MNRLLRLSSLLFLALPLVTLPFFTGACAPKTQDPVQAPFHLPLDLTSKEYQQLLALNPRILSGEQDPKLQQILKIGERNLKWVDIINKSRPKEKWILLSTKETQVGIPMDAPKLYNDSTIAADYDKVVSETNAVIVSILNGTMELPKQTPVSDDEFTIATRAIDKSYQNASRWLLLEPYLWQMSELRQKDIRGYYFLSRIENRAAKLSSYATLSDTEKETIRLWLTGMCFNTEGDDRGCKAEFDSYLNAHKDLNAYYAAYEARSHDIYEAYFDIPDFGRRSDLAYTKSADGAELFSIPFRDPNLSRILAFVKDNVEDEWKGAQWALKLKVVNDTSLDTAHITFEAGTTPHVDRLGGSEITMDQNVSLDDYNNNWTIRHEFGHVLGFPDCYLEYYDTQKDIIVSYQLDLDNLMCSRKGRLLPFHYNELKKAYARNP